MDTVIHVDEKDHVIAEVARDEAHKKGLLHRIAVIYVTNDQGEMLIQERMNGRLDHSSAGHVDFGESYEQAAYRELNEELGITNVILSEVAYAKTEEKKPNGDITRHVYKIFECIATPGELNPEEVRSVFWEDHGQH